MIERDLGAQPGGWRVTELAGTAGELHGREIPDGPQGVHRQVWVMAPSAPALVLGSTQEPEQLARGASEAIEVVRRRSGGGAVLVDPADTVWIDVVVPRGDPLWHDDVGTAFLWLGEVWATTLRDLGLPTEVHRGALVRTAWSGLVCFAGVGPGEVLVGGRKVVGLSQRRTRAAARFQCALYLGDEPGPVAATARWMAPPGAVEDLRAALVASAGGVGVGRDEVVGAFLTHLPA